jgi:tetratricopeptide (TPR) repeat protein
VRVWLALLLGMAGMAVSGPWASGFGVSAGLRDMRTQARPSGWDLENVHSLVRGTFWEIRRSLAILTWNEAQVYFHKGYDLSAFTPPKEGSRPAPTSDESRGKHEHEHAHGDAAPGADEAQPRIHTPEEEARIHSLEDHPFLRRSPLRPYIYEHADLLTNGERMMPYYWLTTTLDPNFVRAYSNGAYWLAFYYGRPAEAIAYLEEGIAHNPDSYVLYSTLGHICFTKQHRYDLASRYYERAVAANPARNQEERDDCIECLRFLARSYLYSGQPGKAIETCLRAKQIEKLVFGFDTILEEANKALGAPGAQASRPDDSGTSVSRVP